MNALLTLFYVLGFTCFAVGLLTLAYYPLALAFVLRRRKQPVFESRPLTLLRVRLQTERAVVLAEAQVIWSGGRPPEGGGVIHGVGFSRLTPDASQAIRDTFHPPVGMRHAGVRLPLDLSATCHPKRPDGPPLQGRTGNVNRGGLFLRLPRLVPPGTVIEVTLHAPRGPLRLEGTVVWVEPHEIWIPGESIGHGLRFAAPDWPTLVSLGLLLVQPA